MIRPRKFIRYRVTIDCTDSSSEEDWTRSRSMNLDVTVGAICVLRVQVMLRTRRLDRTNIVSYAVACQTKLRHATGRQ